MNKPNTSLYVSWFYSEAECDSAVRTRVRNLLEVDVLIVSEENTVHSNRTRAIWVGEETITGMECTY